MEDILEPLCDKSDLKPYCREYYYDFAVDWANDKHVQQALNIRQGTIGTWEFFNRTMHYTEGKNDTLCYAYDIHSSFAYHKKLISKTCRALIFSGDHDMTFPYVGIEQWISSLNLTVDSPWVPIYVNSKVEEMLAELSRREKDANIKLDPDIDVYMKLVISLTRFKKWKTTLGSTDKQETNPCPNSS